MTTPSLQTLHGELEALSAAMEAGRHEDALQLMSGYDQHLRAFVESHEQLDTVLTPLHDLLSQQNALLERIRQHRDEAAQQLRQLRQSNNATLAYKTTP